MKVIVLLALLFAPAASFAANPASSPVQVDVGGSALTASVAIRVDDREKTLQKAIDLARERGGWFAELTMDRVSLRVPAGEARALVDVLRSLGEVFERTFDSVDLQPQMADLEGRLKSRREVLARYMEVLAGASPKAIVSVEREITRVIAEIEGFEGQLRVLRDRAAYARIDVSFRYRERRAPSRVGNSSFAWINRMNMAEVVNALEAGTRAEPSRIDVSLPEGFSAFRKESRFQALSPDDVIYRVRSAPNRPEADLKFWREALTLRMREAGYRVLAEEDLEGSMPGFLLETAGANGEKDQVYLVGLFVKGRHLILAEATGEATKFAKRREAVATAIRDLGR